MFRVALPFPSQANQPTKQTKRCAPRSVGLHDYDPSHVSEPVHHASLGVDPLMAYHKAADDFVEEEAQTQAGSRMDKRALYFPTRSQFSCRAQDSCSVAFSPSVAASGSNIFLTGNWLYATTSNSGGTWNIQDPSSGMSGTPIPRRL